MNQGCNFKTLQDFEYTKPVPHNLSYDYLVELFLNDKTWGTMKAAKKKDELENSVCKAALVRKILLEPEGLARYAMNVLKLTTKTTN